MEFDAFLIIFAVVMLFIFVSIATTRRAGGPPRGRVCRGCGAAHPPFARYCRRCGQPLEG